MLQRPKITYEQSEALAQHPVIWLHGVLHTEAAETLKDTLRSYSESEIEQEKKNPQTHSYNVLAKPLLSD